MAKKPVIINMARGKETKAFGATKTENTYYQSTTLTPKLKIPRANSPITKEPEKKKNQNKKSELTKLINVIKRKKNI